jgi:hypothetical protein
VTHPNLAAAVRPLHGRGLGRVQRPPQASVQGLASSGRLVCFESDWAGCLPPRLQPAAPAWQMQGFRATLATTVTAAAVEIFQPSHFAVWHITRSLAPFPHLCTSTDRTTACPLRRGHYGRVFRARQRSSDREVAVKVLDRGKSRRERLRLEVGAVPSQP